MIDNWLYIGISVIFSLFIPAAAIFIAYVISPKKPGPIKNSTYECGIETYGDSRVQFKAQYYVIALLYLVFDVETVFLFPWAIAYGKLKLFGVIEGIIFILVLAGALIYAWRKGALEWQ